MFVLRQLASVLVCFAIAACAGEACASIVVPKVALELSVDDVLSAVAESEGTFASASGSRDSGPSTPLPQPENPWRFGLSAYAGPLGPGSSSNMGGSSSPTFGSGGPLAVAFASGLNVDDALVGWLSQSKWLDIPMPPGVSLLRPPQAV